MVLWFSYIALLEIRKTDTNKMHNLIDRYVECTSSSIQALALFKKLYPRHRTEEIDNCISKGANFIESMQRNDGSWLVFDLDTMRLHQLSPCSFQ